MNDFINKLENYNLFTLQSRITSKLLNFAYKLKVNYNAPIELKKTLESIVPLTDLELKQSSHGIYSLRSGNVEKKEITKTNFGHLTFKYFFSRFLSIFKNVNFAQKQEAFELQINVNHRQYLEAFLDNFPNFNIKFNNFSNFKKKKKKK